MVLTISLETALSQTAGVNVPCKLTSPYRLPLTKFLNKWAPEAIAYFLEPTRLDNAAYFLRFLDILRSEAGRPLLKQLAASVPVLQALFKPPPSGEGETATQVGRQLAHQLSELRATLNGLSRYHLSQQSVELSICVFHHMRTASHLLQCNLTLCYRRLLQDQLIVRPYVCLLALSGAVSQQLLDAQFQAIQLLAVVVDLLPDWLPDSLFEMLLQRWRSPARTARYGIEHLV